MKGCLVFIGKVVLAVVLVVIVLVTMIRCVSCSGGSSGNTNEGGSSSNGSTFTPDNDGEQPGCGAEHQTLQNKIDQSTEEDSYSELFSIFKEAAAHKNNKDCDLNMYELLENMSYGEWKDADGNFLRRYLCYTDYNNTKGSSLFSTNLPNSKIIGSDYYFYTKADGDKLVIGYEDDVTNEEKDNFVITYKENSILVSNKIDNSTYSLNLNADFVKIQKGNAKRAYEYIAKNIMKFDSPILIQATKCYVDYDSGMVYATLVHSYLGVQIETVGTYKFYEVDGVYYVANYYGTIERTNVDIDELNNKLYSYVSSKK